MRSRIIGLLMAGLLLILFYPAQGIGKIPDDKTLTFAFYNVENLYDTKDDPRTHDEEFLPGSKKQWTPQRYFKKINDLSRVIKELGGDELPAVIGLCEVENDRVLKDLVSASGLSAGHYQIIHFDDRDTRGIDLALLFRPSRFSVMSQRLIPVKSSRGGIFARGILQVTGKTDDGEIFHVFVNHWPSRENGEMAKETGRKEMALALRNLVASARASGKNSHIVIMGDMNDEPGNESLARVLGAASPGRHPESGLINLMIPAFNRGEGTVKFQGKWEMLDNLIVSESLMNGKGYHVDQGRGYVYHAPWMEYRNKKGEISPSRTYVGVRYAGGPSDHFPVYFRMRISFQSLSK